MSSLEQRLLMLLEDQTGVQIERPNSTFFDHKLWALSGTLGYDKVASLMQDALEHPARPTCQAVMDALLNHETSFFRDPTAFRHIQEIVLPELLEKNRESKKLRVWSGACSWGQEAYSMAMAILELAPQYRSWQVDILASDFSQRCIESARSGHFSQLQVNRGLPAHLMVRHFRREGAQWQAAPGLRQTIKFQVLNLIHPWPFAAPFDLILLRNVLVYFGAKNRAETLERLPRLLTPGGIVVFGQSEGLLDLGDGFELVTARTFNFSRRLK